MTAWRMILVLLAAMAWPLAAAEIEGAASWYGEGYRGARMANGQPFDPDALTGASRDFALGARVRVTAGRRAVVVTITDRGPSRALRERGRVIDLSAAAFRRLAPPDDGLVRVTVEGVR